MNVLVISSTVATADMWVGLVLISSPLRNKVQPVNQSISLSLVCVCQQPQMPLSRDWINWKLQFWRHGSVVMNIMMQISERHRVGHWMKSCVLNSAIPDAEPWTPENVKSIFFEPIKVLAACTALRIAWCADLAGLRSILCKTKQNRVRQFRQCGK